MPRYMLKRMWGHQTDAEMLEHGRRSKQVGTEFPDITWDHSHVVVDDEGRAVSYCVYEAPSAERVLEHASVTGGHVVDRVYELAEDLSPEHLF